MVEVGSARGRSKSPSWTRWSSYRYVGLFILAGPHLTSGYLQTGALSPLTPRPFHPPFGNSSSPLTTSKPVAASVATVLVSERA